MSSPALAVQEQLAHEVRPQPVQRTEVLAVVLLTAAAFGLRLFGIERESLWIDEGWSLWFSRLDLGVLWGDASKIELHPPLYYTLLKLWTALFGFSDFALRSLSAWINALTAPLVYMTARWAAPRSPHRVGLLAAFLFEVGPAQLIYSQEARGYTLLVFALAITLAACVAIVRGFFAAGTGGSPQRRLGRWPFVALGFGMGFLVWSHNVGCVYAGVAGLWMTAFWLIGAKASRPLFLGLALSAGVFVALVARPLWTLFAYALGNASEFWLKAPDAYFLLLQLSELFGGALYTGGFGSEVILRLVLFGLWPLITVVGALRCREPGTRWSIATLAALSFGLALANALATYLAKPIFMLRTVLPVQVGWSIFCALSVLFVSTRLRRVALAGICAAFLLGLGSYYARRPLGLYKRPWREALFTLAREAQPRATVFTMANREPLTKHYLAAAGRQDLRVVPLPAPMSVPDVAACFGTEAGCPFFTREVTEQEFATAISQLGNGSGAWLLLMDGESLFPHSVTDPGAVFTRYGAQASWDARKRFKDLYLYPPTHP